jgi:tetratricopeptide (TPR) repeat protein
MVKKKEKTQPKRTRQFPWIRFAFASALVLATFLAYQPAWHGGMLWDDDAHLTRPELQSVDGLRRIWFDVGSTQQYYPVVHSAFWVFNAIWGADTLGYHLVNIALHAGSALLLALILVRLGVPGAFLSATLFALHPVQVESVAWMTELKNTLSTFCYLVSALVYLRFDRTRQASVYLVSLLVFAIALFSKTVTASLPAALLVVFWWQRGRLTWRRDVTPLLPFFALGIAAAATTAWFERSLLGAIGIEYSLGPLDRLLLAGRAVWFYFGKLLWPANLAFIYPRWRPDIASAADYLYVVALAAVLAVLWAIRSRTRSPLAAALLYIGTLFPALGFFNVYPFRYSFVADHFQYLATAPMLAALAAGLVLAISRVGMGRRVGEVLLIAVLAIPFGLLTWRQSHEYRDSETLFRTTLARNPDCWLCYNNLATPKLYGSDEDVAEAVRYLTEALRLNPHSAEAHNNIGGAYQRLGKLDDALREHREALRLNPKLVDAQYNIGVVAQALGRADDARAAYADVLRARPDYAAAHHNLGTILASENRLDEAARHFSEAVRLDSADWQTHYSLGLVLMRAGRLENATRELGEAARLNPAAVGARYHFAIALATSGRTDQAIQEFQAALRIAPGAAEIHHDLGAALANAGRLSEALPHLEEALRLQPSYESARQNLARVRAALVSRQPRR